MMILDFLPYLGVAIIEFTIIALFLYIGRKSYFAINFYYFGRFVLRFFMHDVQVRYQVVASILLISFCLLAAFFVVKNKKFYNYNVPCLRNIIIVILAVVPIEVLWGFINGYQIFQIAVDVYKVLEIIIFFVLIKFTWHNIPLNRCTSSLASSRLSLLSFANAYSNEILLFVFAI